ncbi:ISL3 family transposase [Streptomyces jumonjinensis]|uniref:ISL3 family transposase n=1 Tax=Streptomyces jumonjinensis TaxID=1945 RepID=A0A646KP38_STRJU|nr:ISL3 family transposase [Streptomyces jumonjinensis]
MELILLSSVTSCTQEFTLSVGGLGRPAAIRPSRASGHDHLHGNRRRPQSSSSADARLIAVVGKSLRIRARCAGSDGVCPARGTSSGRVHSRYARTLADISVAGRAVGIELRVRRFFCDDAACGKRTFAEQADGLTVRYGRRTPAAQWLLERVALALGGQAGGRLTAHMAVPTSGSTLLRTIHRLDVPAPPKVEVLGVDELSLRRGRVFGTILIDMASRRPVDVLPDHTADTFATWLREHPGVRMVCRDRGGAFAEAAERALPGVPQVADRWHVLDNLATAVEKAVRRHRACLNPPREPDQDAQTPDLRPRELRPPTTTNTPLGLTAFTEIAEDPPLSLWSRLWVRIAAWRPGSAPTTRTKLCGCISRPMTKAGRRDMLRSGGRTRVR